MLQAAKKFQLVQTVPAFILIPLNWTWQQDFLTHDDTIGLYSN